MDCDRFLSASPRRIIQTPAAVVVVATLLLGSFVLFLLEFTLTNQQRCRRREAPSPSWLAALNFSFMQKTTMMRRADSFNISQVRYKLCSRGSEQEQQQRQRKIKTISDYT